MQSLGFLSKKWCYTYVIFPALAGAIIMLLVALLVNNLSTNPKRHYPVYWCTAEKCRHIRHR